MKWIETLKLFLPYIGGAILGPAGGIAIRAGISALGGDEEYLKAGSDAIEPIKLLEKLVMNATHDDFAGAQLSDNQFKINMANIGVKLEEAKVKDRISARDLAKSVGAIWHHLVGISLVASNIAVLFWILQYGLPIDSSQVVLLIIGILQGWGGAYLLFLYGSSKGSKDKDSIISELSKK